MKYLLLLTDQNLYYNNKVINSQLMEVDIYGDEDTPVETIGQHIRRIRIALKY